MITLNPGHHTATQKMKPPGGPVGQRDLASGVAPPPVGVAGAVSGMAESCLMVG